MSTTTTSSNENDEYGQADGMSTTSSPSNINLASPTTLLKTSPPQDPLGDAPVTALDYRPVNTNVPAPTDAAGDKLCLVCGDKGIGYNYGIFSCESDKAFFRRNARLNKEFKCPFENRCEITVKTRKYCQKCRLNKCFLVGMRKEMIQNDGHSKRRGSNSGQVSSSSSSSTSTAATAHKSSAVYESGLDSGSDNSSHGGPSEDGSFAFNDQGYLKEVDCFNDYLEEYYQSDIESIIARIDAGTFTFPAENLLNFVCNKAVQYEFMFMDRFIYRSIHSDGELDHQHHTESGMLNFEADYTHRLEELRQACSILLPKYFDVDNQIVNIIAAIQASEINIINLIKMTKMLSTFKNLPIEEQVQMLNANIKEITTIYNVILYNGQLNCLTFYNQVINFNTLNQICSPQISSICRSNIIEFQELIKEDINIFNLLVAIILFKPRIESTIDKEYIRNQYLIYVHMLKRYLQNKIGNKCLAETLYIRILVKLEEMYVLSSVVYKCFYNIDKSKLSNFFREIIGDNNF